MQIIDWFLRDADIDDADIDRKSVNIYQYSRSQKIKQYLSNRAFS